MSHGSPSPVSLHDVPAIVRAEPFVLPSFKKIVLWLFVGIGIVAFAMEITNGEAKRAWTALQVNFMYWWCLAAASTCFSAVLHICNAQWARPIRRLFESASNFFLIAPIFLLILYFGSAYDHLFSWAHHDAPGKAEWLRPNLVYIRDIIAMLLLIFLGRKIVCFSIARDIGAVRGGLTGLKADEISRWNDKSYDSYVRGWGSDTKKEIQRVHDSMGRLSPVVVMAYALLMTLVIWDQLMSVDPLWYSTMFAGFVFMGGVYVAMAFCSMGVGLMRVLHPLFRAKIERRTLHDLGKLLFGFGIFWTYLFWSHYLPIWYGNMPEETAWLILRLRVQPWHSVAWVVLGMSFIIPFLLGINRDLKQVPALLFCTGVIVACGQWLQHLLLFAPTLYPDTVPFGLTEIGVTLGFLGIYVLSAAAFLARVPLMPFGDLYILKK